MKNKHLRENLKYSQCDCILADKTCLGHTLKFKDNNRAYIEGIVISLSPRKVVIYCDSDNKTYSVKWANVLENINI